MFTCRWSHDGKYFARLSADRLSVYETSVSDCGKLCCAGLQSGIFLENRFGGGGIRVFQKLRGGGGGFKIG